MSEPSNSRDLEKQLQNVDPYTRELFTALLRILDQIADRMTARTDSLNERNEEILQVATDAMHAIGDRLDRIEERLARLEVST